MLRKRTYFGILVAVILAQPAFAGEATEDGAKKLQETFQKYLGSAAGEGGSLKIKPDGEAYVVSFDVGAALAPFADSGLKVEPAVVTFHVAAQDDGTYKVNDLQVPALVVTVKEMKIAYSFDGTSFEGTFDPKIAGFANAESKFGKITYEQVAPDAVVHVAEKDVAGSQTGTAVAPGISSIKQKFTIGSLSEQIEKPSGGPGSKVNIDFGSLSADIGIDALHAQSIWDVWAFFVAHPSKEALASSTAELKGLLNGMLPIFDKLDENLQFSNVGVDTPAGRFTLGEFGLRLATSGAVPQGSYALTLSAGKPGMPVGMVKPWQTKLIPSSVSIGATMTGLNLEGAAKQIINDFDLTAKKPLQPDSWQKAGEILWSSGPLKVTMVPSHIESQTLMVQLSGDATINRGGPPSLHLLVSAKGLDETMQTLNDAKGEDPMAGQAVLFVATAKGLAKPGADGTLTWEINVGPDGAPTINGAKLGGR